MSDKTFRVDWHFRDALIDFSRLKAEEIGVLMQIINLIYFHNGSIDNDPKFIGKNCNITPAKCKRIISTLISEGHIYLTQEGKISKKRCEEELAAVDKRRKISSENGEKGAKLRWGNQENQHDNNGEAIKLNIASTNTNKSTNYNTKPFNIDHYLTDEARKTARANAPGWDQHYLMGIYDEWVNVNGDTPDKPNAAYPAWCASFTKGKNP